MRNNTCNVAVLETPGNGVSQSSRQWAVALTLPLVTPFLPFPKRPLVNARAEIEVHLASALKTKTHNIARLYNAAVAYADDKTDSEGKARRERLCMGLY